ncbi:hypothetical protein QQS21_008678 [Conoideocrella luteorostrata]|uniref:Uncharacterized protein n=1 Tax=Conoideocrella luteorostrata TaxID=1105319 RepID=A0AAJ0CIE7_9HYPO|nr:hypothetical protein QQS21_008678 [Conoideocrella luteorostrata]
MSDTQLGDFTQKHRQLNVSCSLPVNDWDRLSNSERDYLAERLRSIQRAIIDSPTASTRPLDLDKVDVLLRDVCSKEYVSAQDRTRERERITESPDIHPQEFYRQQEMEAYNNLVNDSGCPLYPIDLVESISTDPDAYYEMLEPFRRQPRAAEIEADPSSLKRPGEPWYYIQRHRYGQRRYLRELGCTSFSEYEVAIKARLAQHNFTQLFHLAENPEEQDQLTTWSEHIGFEYCWLDRYIKSFEQLKPEHDNAWSELKKQGKMKDNESPESIRTNESAIRYQQEDRLA